ncbi:MAG: ion channel [Thiotrichaceae bacterium]|nr:ion channel [Thiotrichaceae bacterium]
MHEFLIGSAFSMLLVLITILMHYETLRVLSIYLPRMHMIHPRMRLMLVIVGVFTGHTIEIWLFGIAFYLLETHLKMGHFGGLSTEIFMDYVYFSAVCYTSLGLGDMYPTGMLRMLTGAEALVGLLMIAWSGSFTYLAMEKFWDVGGRRQ